MPQPQRSSGSDHRRSHMGPSWGTSWTRSKFLMLSSVSIDGDNPPWRQNISDSTCKRREIQGTSNIMSPHYIANINKQTSTLASNWFSWWASKLISLVTKFQPANSEFVGPIYPPIEPKSFWLHIFLDNVGNQYWRSFKAVRFPSYCT